jgi:LPXTG-motif cell wall-anchored protein
LNVNSGVEEQGLDMVYILAIIIIVLAILLLLIFIRKKRHKLRVSR